MITDRNKPIWLTWNNSTRSRSLSNALDFEFLLYSIESPFILRHLLSPFWTIYFLVVRGPSVIACQYSFLLLVVIAIYKKVKPNTFVLVDCHNKALKRKISNSPINSFFEGIKKWSFNYADISIVTNKGMLPKLKEYTSVTQVLSDPLPFFDIDKTDTEKDDFTDATFVSSFAADEPFQLLIEYAQLNPDIHISITGKPTKDFLDTFILPNNIVLTGYLSQSDYVKLLVNSDFIICLSTETNILQCSIYEAISLGCLVVTNRTNCNYEVFRNAVAYCDLDIESMSQTLRQLKSESEFMSSEIQNFRLSYQKKMKYSLTAIKNSISSATTDYE